MSKVTNKTILGSKLPIAASIAFVLLVMSTTGFAETKKPDFSDWVPPKNKLSYGQDGGSTSNGGLGGRIHTVTTCKQFLGLFGAKSPLRDYDTIKVNFKSNCKRSRYCPT